MVLNSWTNPAIYEWAIRIKPRGRQQMSIGDFHYVDYKTIVATIGESVAIIQDGKIVFANHSFSQLSGKSIPELLGVAFVDIVSSIHKIVVMEFIDAFDGREDKNNIKFQLNGTAGKLVEMKLSPIKFDQRNAFLCRLNDISPIPQNTLDVIRLQMRLRSILDSMHFVVLSFSFPETTNKLNLKNLEFYDTHLVEMNPAAELLYGVPIKDFLQKKKSIFDYVHATDKKNVLWHYHNLPRKGIDELTYRIIRSDNEVRWVRDCGKVEYQGNNRIRRINRIIEDITANKKAIDDLRTNEKKYRRIFERSKDMIYVVDHEGNFIDINPAGLKLLGIRTYEEAKLRNISDFYVDPRAREDLLNELIEKGEASTNKIILWKCRGEIIEVDLNAIAKRDGDGKVISYQGIVTNITEALRQRELESISQLAGCFADDLTSPLNAVMINLEATAEELGELENFVSSALNQEKEYCMAKAEKSIRRLFEELIDFNKSAMTTCKEIAARLKEIREEYWRLRKVSDGFGGSIYERHSKSTSEKKTPGS
jgi:PAS domain S-box-containing protein